MHLLTFDAAICYRSIRSTWENHENTRIKKKKIQVVISHAFNFIWLLRAPHLRVYQEINRQQEVNHAKPRKTMGATFCEKHTHLN